MFTSKVSYVGIEKRGEEMAHLSNFSSRVEQSLKDVSENDTRSECDSHSFDSIENRVDDMRTRYKERKTVENQCQAKNRLVKERKERAYFRKYWARSSSSSEGWHLLLRDRQCRVLDV